LDLGAFGQ